MGSQIKNIPAGDVLIHTGDHSFKGTFKEMLQCIYWLEKLDFKKIIIILGNHELGVEDDMNPLLELLERLSGKIVLLHDSAYEYEGVKFYGSPWQPWFYDWAWNFPERDDGTIAKATWAKIPDDTNVLLTHGPPRGIGDKVLAQNGHWDDRVGCSHLLERVLQLKDLKVHAYGHIHEAYGLRKKHGIIFSNGSICTRDYKPTNEPIVIDI
jgi:Icc-related predicted phosphoesterase